MKDVKIPEGYQQIMPYLIVENAAEFFSFMKSVFGAREKYKNMRTETLIRHAELKIGDSVIMFADATEDFNPQNAGMFVYVDDCDKVYEKALSHGALTVMPPADQEYGRSAGISDPFGNTWWITSL
ncbi:VOC family protein [Mucilaginibacter ginsenosidivorans]|uniref:VOC family protein n=1 Tax=Mucilaginibacter ginsenosidivorans TaxID=398053 RepID=A0A5B8UTD5_9SPHI|nr:VOC family protein [Mucilaginibacter ginsenosidivorans]QEC62264.1 VOC family protein [Mucilaginibacter ginsenosidivorans]